MVCIVKCLVDPHPCDLSYMCMYTYMYSTVTAFSVCACAGQWHQCGFCLHGAIRWTQQSVRGPQGQKHGTSTRVS